MAVVVFVEDGDAAARFDDFDAQSVGGGEGSVERTFGLLTDGGEQLFVVEPQDQVHVPEDVAEQGHVLKESDAAGVFPDAVEDTLDGAAMSFVGSSRDHRHGLAEHEVHHGLHAPGDVVLDDDFATGGAAVVG